jgi:hypothetical protein
VTAAPAHPGQNRPGRNRPRPVPSGGPATHDEADL